VLLHRYLYRILYKISLPSIVFFRQDIFSKKKKKTRRRKSDKSFPDPPIESFSVIYTESSSYHFLSNLVFNCRHMRPVLACVLATRIFPGYTVNIYGEMRKSTAQGDDHFSRWQSESSANLESQLCHLHL